MLQPPSGGGGGALGGARRGGQAQAQAQDELFDRDVPPPPPRTKWTRRVPHSVLIGHAASLSQVRNYFAKSSLPHGLKKAIGGSVGEAARLGTGSSGIR